MPPRPRKLRLDELLVARGDAPTRAQAQALIRAGKVRTAAAVLDKPGKSVPEDLVLEIVQPPRFVSRGGEKLAGFLQRYAIDVTGLTFLDVGASTGGFTDCLLQAGASDATCVDVGTGQLHYKLRTDPRVTNFERVNARGLADLELPFAHYDLVVMDLSFISLKLILGPAWQRVKPTGQLIALVKPQFEAGKAEVDAVQGVIRDPEIHQRVVKEIKTWVSTNLSGSALAGEMESPIKGGDGNTEFLLGWKKVAPGG